MPVPRPCLEGNTLLLVDRAGPHSGFNFHIRAEDCWSKIGATWHATTTFVLFHSFCRGRGRDPITSMLPKERRSFYSAIIYSSRLASFSCSLLSQRRGRYPESIKGFVQKGYSAYDGNQQKRIICDSFADR